MFSIITLEEIIDIFNQNFFNKTNKVTKITKNSVLSGFSYANAKIAQKAFKDIAVATSVLDPDFSYGTQLDKTAQIWGVKPRQGESGSSVYIRLFATPGTQYFRNQNLFTTRDGLQFRLESDYTMGPMGFDYVKLDSLDTGLRTNIEPLSINNVLLAPVGHQYATNDFYGFGGTDIETDFVFRERIKKSYNRLATNTIEFLTQVLIDVDNTVLRIYPQGLNAQGKYQMAILAVNGTSYSSEQLSLFESSIQKYLSLYDLKPDGIETRSVKFTNVTWFPIDVDFRISITPGQEDIVRKRIQTSLFSLVDYRFWKEGNKVEWDDMLQIAKNQKDVIYVPDNLFLPNADIIVPFGQLPRLRNFVMRDLDGNIIEDLIGNLNPIYYPNSKNEILALNIINA